MRQLYVVVLVVAAVLLASITSLLRNAQTCACEQTYMYTSYTEIPLLDPRWANHRYKLRLYRETGYTRQVLPPDGLPALLIPGNAGSYEQVRSLASETARMAAQARKSGGSSRSMVDMDWYALDLNGELSAFDGYLLSEQTSFALACLKQLRAMYSSSSSSSAFPAHGPHQQAHVARLLYNLRPQLLTAGSSSRSNSGGAVAADAAAAIVLVGHSMGGVIARAAATAAWEDPGLGPSSIALLLTLASPHQYPPLMLQPDLARFYGDWASRPLPAGLPAVSVHGGAADMQVSTYLTRLPPPALSLSLASLSSSAAHISMGSEHIPGVWLAAGHTQIDWCNQLVRRLSAALLEVHAQQQYRLQHPQQQQQQQGQPERQQGRSRALLLQWMQQQQSLVELEGGLVGAVHAGQQQHQPELWLLASGKHGLCAGSNATCSKALHTSTAHWPSWWRAAGDSSNQRSSSSSSTSEGEPAVVGLQRRRSARLQLQYAKRAAAASSQSLRDIPQQQQQQQWQLMDSAGVHQQQQQQQGLVDVGVLLQPFADERAAAAAAPGAAAHTHSTAAPGAGARMHLTASLGGGAYAQRQLLGMDVQLSVSSSGFAGRGVKFAAAMQQAPGAAATSNVLRKYLVHHSLVPTDIAAAAAGQGGSASASSLPQLLLPGTAPSDVQLAVTGSCAGPQVQPGWFVDSLQAAQSFMPPQEMTFTAQPSTAAGLGGSVLFWDAPGAADFVLVVSGAKPCGSFRVWVLQQQQQQQQQQRWVDLSGHAVLLPVLQDELVRHIRDFNGWSDVMAGKDYLADAAWAVLLSQQQLAAHSATRIAIWLAPAAAQQPGSNTAEAAKVNGTEASNIVVQPAPAAARLSAQWLPAATQHQQQAPASSANSVRNAMARSSSVPGPQLALGPSAMLRPLLRPAGGAVLLQLQPRWQWLIGGLSVKVHAAAAAGRSGGGVGAGSQGQAGPSSSTCWQPVAMYSSTWGGLQHVTMLNTTCSSCSSSGSWGAALTAASHIRQAVKTWFRASVKASSKPGFTSSMRNSVLLSDVQPGSNIQLLLDPSCDYSISLKWDAVDAAAQVLLAHANSAAGMAVALLLLVLSHQMSALIRQMAVARQGATPTSCRPNSGSSRDKPAAAAAAAAGVNGKDGGFMNSLQQQQEHSAPATPTAGTVRPDLRQLSTTALQRLRNRLDGTLGGAPPELHTHTTPSAPPPAAAAASFRPDSQAGAVPGLDSAAGISVLESLLAVTSDLRVLLLAALLAAAASTLNNLNPASVWYSSSSSGGGGGGGGSAQQAAPPSPATARLLPAVGWVLHKCLALLGLSQRGDSPSVLGAGLLLGVALLFLLLAVWLTVGVKWCLDWCSATITAFNRSLTPNPETMAAIAATSSGGANPHMAAASSSGAANGAGCPCALCAAAAAACGVNRTSSGGFYGGSLLEAAGCLEGMAAAAAAATGGSAGAVVDLHRNATRAAAGLDVGLAAAPEAEAAAAPPAVAELSRSLDASTLSVITASLQQHQQQWPQQQQQRQQQQQQRRRPARPGAPWWWQRRSQVQLLILLLLSTANIALGLAGGVLLLFFTWHLPSSSTAAAARVAELLLGSRAGSRASSRPASRATSPLPAGIAAAAAAAAGHGSRSPRHSIPGSPRLSVPGAAQAAAAAGSVAHNQHSLMQQPLRGGHSPTRLGSLATQSSGGNAALAAAAGKAVHQQRPVRSDAGLMVDADEDTEDSAAQPHTASATPSQLLQTDGQAAAAAQDAAAGVSVLPHSADSVQQQHAAHPWQQQQQQQYQVLPEGSLTSNLSRLGQPSGGPDHSNSRPKAAAAAVGGSGDSADLSAAVSVVSSHNAAAARAVALHQLTCHMCHAWTLLYGCCCLMLLPSLLAWLQLPWGQQHLSHWLDVLLVLPVLLHCTAIAAGTVQALVGYGPATAAEARRIRHGTSRASSSMRLLGVAGAAAGHSQASGPVDVYKLVVRGASVYMFAAALMCQPVVWLAVVAAVASLMLGGQAAVEAWHRLHVWLHGGGQHDAAAYKQKGT